LALSPIFFGIQRHDLLLLRLFAGQTFKTFDRYDNAVSIIAVIIAIIAIGSIPAFLTRLRAGTGMFVAAATASIYFVTIAGVESWVTGDFFPFLGAIQYVLPIVAIPAGFLYGERVKLPLPAILSIYAAMNVVLPGLGFIHYYFFAGERFFAALSLTGDVFYGLYTIIPAMVIAALAFLSFIKPRTLPVVAGCLIILSIVVWSRASIAVGSISTATFAAFLLFEAARRRTWRPLLLSAAYASMAAAISLVPLYGIVGYRATSMVPEVEAPNVAEENGLTVGRRAFEKAESEDKTQKTESWLDVSDQSRMAYLKEGIERWRAQPVFGIRFKPEYPAVVYRYVVDKKQIFQPHNQYIDILMKTGIAGLILVAGFYLRFVAWPLLRIAFSSAPFADRLPLIAWGCILVAFAAMANFQNFFTTWTSGVPIGFLTGYFLAKQPASRTALPQS
jgi:hypothetical protein